MKVFYLIVFGTFSMAAGMIEPAAGWTGWFSSAGLILFLEIKNFNKDGKYTPK